jgi:hypothetical protein
MLELLAWLTFALAVYIAIVVTVIRAISHSRRG